MFHPYCALARLVAEDLAGPGIDENAANLTSDTQFDSIHGVRPLQKLDAESLAARNHGESLGQRFGRADELATLVIALNVYVIAVVGGLFAFIDTRAPALKLPALSRRNEFAEARIAFQNNGGSLAARLLAAALACG